MPIRTALLNKTKRRGDKLVAECPACAETGGDAKGIHLVVYTDGRFGCAANPRDKAHRRRIAELVGDPNPTCKPWQLKLGGKVVMSGGTSAATPIFSLARQEPQRQPLSAKQPSVASVMAQETAIPDATDALSVYSNLCFSRVQEYDKKETHRAVYRKQASATSRDIVTAAAAMFDGKVCLFAPNQPLPPRFADVLRGWCHCLSSVLLPPDRPQLLGWRRNGQPIYAKSTKTTCPPTPQEAPIKAKDMDATLDTGQQRQR